MSEYCVVQLEVTDKEILTKALSELGYKYEVHSKPVSLYGYQGDVRPEQANIVIRRKNLGSAANDIGFLKEGKKYKMIISEFDKTAAHSDGLLNKLKQVYSKHKILKQVEKMGYKISNQKVDANGRLRIRIST